MGWINQSRALRLIDFIKSIKKKNGDQINHKSLLNLYLRNKTQTRLSIFVISDSQHHKIQNRKRKYLQGQHWGRKHFRDSASDCKCAKSNHIKSKWTSWLEILKLVEWMIAGRYSASFEFVMRSAIWFMFFKLYKWYQIAKNMTNNNPKISWDRYQKFLLERY